MSMNMAILAGNVGADPEVRQTATGQKVATFSLATGEKWTDRQTGEKKEATEWHRVVVWGGRDGQDGLAGVVEQYVRKGAKLNLVGQIKTRKWTSQDGVDRYTTEIVLQGARAQLMLMGGRAGPRAPESPDDYGRTSTSPGRGPVGGGGPSDGTHLDDDIPF